MEILINVIVILAFCVVGLVLIYILFVQNSKEEEQQEDANYYELPTVTENTRKILDNVQTADISEYKLNHTNAEKKEKQKNKLRTSIQLGVLGDRGSKDYTKSYIQDVLQQELKINAKTIDKVIAFNNPWKLSTHIKFLMLYHMHNKLRPNKAFSSLCETYKWNVPRKCEDGDEYIVTSEDIEEAFEQEEIVLDFPEKMDILSQVIYECLYGADVVDSFMYDASMDGFSGGCGGKTRIEYDFMEEIIENGELRMNCYDTIYAMYQGVTIRLAFLTFEELKRLQRVVKNVYRYDAKTPLNASTPIVKGHNMQNDRILVCRPPVSGSWCFYIRKFNSSKPEDITSLIRDIGCEIPIEILKESVRGGLSIAFSGPQYAGKTTLLKSCVRFLGRNTSVRIAEDVFETYMNDLFPMMNMQAMQAYGNVTISDILAAFKRSDCDVTIEGEITETEQAKDLIQISQNGGKMTMCTLHHNTTRKMIEYFVNAMWSILSNPLLAEKQVVNAINLDVHVVVKKGHRYIERITEVVPIEPEAYDENESFKRNFLRYFDQMTQPRSYRLNDLVVYENGRYVAKNTLSKAGLEKIKHNLDEEEVIKFDQFLRDKLDNPMLAV